MGAFAAAIAASTVLILASGMLRSPTDALSADGIFVLAVASDGALLVALMAIGRATLALRPGDLGFRRPSRDALRAAAATAGALWVASIAVNAVQTALAGPHPQALVLTISAHTGPLALALDLATGGVVAPIAEETLYRGLIFAGLAQRMPMAAAAAISAFLFAISHGVGVLLPIFVLGLGLAYVYARTRTIWAPMLTHALINTISLVLVFALPKGLL